VPGGVSRRAADPGAPRRGAAAGPRGRAARRRAAVCRPLPAPLALCAGRRHHAPPSIVGRPPGGTVDTAAFRADLELIPRSLSTLADALDAGLAGLERLPAPTRVLVLGMGSSRYAADVVARR